MRFKEIPLPEVMPAGGYLTFACRDIGTLLLHYMGEGLCSDSIPGYFALASQYTQR